jgi:hypothetical protein
MRLTFDRIGSLGHSQDEKCLSFGFILVIKPYSGPFSLLGPIVRPATLV